MNPQATPENATDVGAGPEARPVSDARSRRAVAGRLSRVWAALVLVAALAALLATGLLWQKVTGMQEQLARQSADAGAQSIEARALARQAIDQTREAAARQAVMEARLAEVALQRAQFDELMQSMSRSRDENLVVDIEAALRLALQQAQLTGSVEPLLAALRSADQRLGRAAQPRLASVQRAINRDIDRIKSTSVTDTPGLLIKIDTLVRLSDELPLANAVPRPLQPGATRADVANAAPDWWQRVLAVVAQEVRSLVRVARIERPEAVLLSPEQAFFVRENLKLRLLNARLGLLARQLSSARADLGAATDVLNTYFDPASRKTQNVATVLQQVQLQMKAVELPRVDDTLAALATAAAGK